MSLPPIKYSNKINSSIQSNYTAALFSAVDQASPGQLPRGQSNTAQVGIVTTNSGVENGSAFLGQRH